jgi:hypothetical protein
VKKKNSSIIEKSMNRKEFSKSKALCAVPLLEERLGEAYIPNKKLFSD